MLSLPSLGVLLRPKPVEVQGPASKVTRPTEIEAQGLLGTLGISAEDITGEVGMGWSLITAAIGAGGGRWYVPLTWIIFAFPTLIRP